jgi:GNAT superfamily N-acetyltransferase
MIVTRRLDASQLDDWLAFFDRDAFTDNPEWGTCYCRCFLFGDGGFDAWDRACATVGENRAVMARAIAEGRIDGLLARQDGRVVGWLHWGPSGRFHPPSGPLEPVRDGLATIVCFVVDPRHRRGGVARALLRAAIGEIAQCGFSEVDARPSLSAQAPAAEQFRGPLELYLSEGFVLADRTEGRARVVRTLDASSTRR